MSKSEDTMHIIKTSTCKTLSGKSTLTYQIGTQDDSSVHVRITKNTGGGFFSDEWISLNDIQSVLDEHPEGTPVTSFLLQPLFHGKSVNTPGFVLSVLVHEKLLRPTKGKKRSHEPLAPEDFTSMVEKLTSSNVKPKATTKRPTKKAAVKKRASIKRKKIPT